VGLKPLARYYSYKRNEFLNHCNVFSEDTWTKRLGDVNLRVVIAQRYLSKLTVEMWDLLDFLAFLGRKLKMSKLQSSIIATKFGKTKEVLYEIMFKRHYYEQSDKGGGLLIVAQA